MYVCGASIVDLSGYTYTIESIASGSHILGGGHNVGWGNGVQHTL